MNEAATHLFGLIFGINFLLIGTASLMAWFMILTRRKRPDLSLWMYLGLGLGPFLFLYGIHLTMKYFN
jgi:Na+/H+ antiporter NhaD/arsenite permease-like protein